MSLPPSESYAPAAVILHWVSAALILSLLPIGMLMSGVESPEARHALYLAHASVGGLAVLLTLARVVLRLVGRRAAPANPWPIRAAHATLLALVLVLGVSGAGMMILVDAPAALAQGVLFGPELFPREGPRVVHGIVSKLLIALFVLHVAGALRHAWRGDGVMARMALRRRRAAA